MGIQQIVPISITLRGNGAATKFAFCLADLPAVNSAGKGIILNPKAIPASVTGAIAERPEDTMAISVAQQGNQAPIINVNFDAPLPDGIFTLNMTFYFDSKVVSREAPPPPPGLKGKGNGRRKKSFDSPRAGP